MPLALAVLGLGWDRGPVPTGWLGRAVRLLVLFLLACAVAEFWAYLLLLAPVVMFVVASVGSHRSRVPLRSPLVGPELLLDGPPSVADAPVSSLSTDPLPGSPAPTEVSVDFVDRAELDVRDQDCRRRDWQQFRAGSRSSP